MWPCGLQPARLLCPWDSLGKNTGVGCKSSSRGSSWSRKWIWVSCIADKSFTTEPPGKPPPALGWAYWKRTFSPATYLLLESFLSLIATTLNSGYILEFLSPYLSQGHSLCSTSAATVLFRNPSTLHRWILWTVTWCLNPFPYSFWSIFYIANSIIFIKLKHTHNSPWDFLGKNPGVSRHLVLQGIFLTLGSNPVSHSRQILHRLSHQGCLIHFI